MSRNRWIWIAVIPLIFLTIFFLWPVAAMVWRGIAADPEQVAAGGFFLDLSGFGEVLGNPRTWQLIWHTVWLAGAGTIGSVLLGIPGAYVLYRTRFFGSAVLRSIAIVPFVLPTVVVGVAFRALLGGPLDFLGLDQTSWAVVLAMVFFNFSVVVRQVGSLWSVLDPQSTEAARTLGASRTRAFVTVTLPALTPAIASSAGLVFLFCSTSYSLVRTLGSPGVGTLETEVFRQTKTFLDLRTAAVLSLLQIAIILISLWVTALLRQKTTTGLNLTTHPQENLTLNLRTDWFPFAVTVATVVGLILTPMLSLVWSSFTLRGELTLENYRNLATSPGVGFAGGATVLEALDHSLKIAMDATVMTVIMGVALAVVLTRTPTTRWARYFQRLVDTLVTLPIGVSAVTVGFGFLISVQPAFPSLATFMVPLAQAVVALPLVVRTLVPVLNAVHPGQREAATMLGASPVRVLLTVDGPYLLRGLGLAIGFAFAVSLGEFGATSFLASPNYQTLPVVIVRLLSRPGAENFGMAMSAAVILAVMSAAVLLICEQLRPRSARTRPGSVSGGATNERTTI